MKNRSRFFLLLPLLALCACEPVAVQYPPGSPQQYPQPNSGGSVAAPQAPEVSGSQRWQHAWTKAMEGIAMGGALLGPYGAGGGLVIGLITGLVTADAHYGQINNQIHTEQRKEQQLEAAIEQELARQRELENQLAGVPAQPKPAEMQSGAAKSPPPQADPAQTPLARPPSNQTASRH